MPDDTETAKKRWQLRKLFDLLAAKGYFVLVRMGDGGDESYAPESQEDAIDTALQVSECEFWFRNKIDQREDWLMLTPYNDGAEMVCDYSMGESESSNEFVERIKAWTEEREEEES